MSRPPKVAGSIRHIDDQLWRGAVKFPWHQGCSGAGTPFQHSGPVFHSAYWAIKLKYDCGHFAFVRLSHKSENHKMGERGSVLKAGEGVGTEAQGD
ncbi:hypothetical protein AVEN_195444-1 [Araneus ventricosus]|uniref:Uncharacterized protein n=1 Tax=Araneus ventricosus TaxID=182803 RepID=A0A4Y2I1D7_ARAVE|nr:hypothetical protein AVEN_195444-1 [Araneus ventricosus]